VSYKEVHTDDSPIELGDWPRIFPWWGSETRIPCVVIKCRLQFL